MPPRFLTEEEKKRLNAAHTEKILLDLGKWQNELGNDPPEEEEEGEGGEEEAVCNRFRARAPDEMANLLAMPDDVDVLERPMSEIMASADAQHSALLKKPKFVTRTSNRDEAFARWLYNNVRSRFEEEVPIRCALFELMPWQRAAAVAMTNPMEEETFVQLDIPRAQMEKLTPRGCRKTPFGVKYSIEAGALPVITLAHLPTGAGKTIIALVAALILLCSSNKWTQLRQSYREILRVRLRETHSGLCKGESVSNGKLARLAVIIVPHNLMSHWEAQAKAAVFGAKECYGQHTDVVLWRGRHHEHSVENAYNSGKPTLWILAMEPDSMKMLCKTPNIGYCARICDELSMRMQARYNQKESPVLYNYITQATIDSLSKATVGQPRHPLRLALEDNYMPLSQCGSALGCGNYSAVDRILQHSCKVDMFVAPDLIRQHVSEEVQTKMPAGIVIHRLRLRAATLAAVAVGTDMVKQSFSDLALGLLGSGVSAACKDQVHAIFSEHAQAEPAEVLRTLAEALEAMPAASMAEHQARQAVIRLEMRMRDIFSGEMPECPISMAPIERADVRILECCTCVIDVRSIPLCSGRCPLCRAPIDGGVAVAQVEQNIEQAKEQAAKEARSDEQGGKRPREAGGKQLTLSPSLRKKPALFQPYSSDDSDADADADADAPPAPPAPPGISCAEFVAKIEAVSASRPTTVDGIVQAVNAQCEMVRSSRILIVFQYQRHQREAVRDFKHRLESEVCPRPAVTNVDAITKNQHLADEVLGRYSAREAHPEPQILLLNNVESSASIQGMDLWATDLTIVNGYAALDTQRQAVGRCLRMQPRPAWMAKEDRFPAKRILLASIS